ncbi:agamous-like mads-box protein agl92 [Phtheirospermum japonicum]|uniref:Agamous-like mads-box protein agl92 n=1 Tax=Phtheirospermum japonicum TaxID=374723 RepID=A0A830CDV8_9LAMI|nr:agamous-like mads-box protein agl92 [Phtheirospermum japonicum]
MGRAKLNMELIPKKKSRHTTFKKRKEGLIKKMHEFTTLCDVKACMIIYGPKQEETGLSDPEIWPQNTEEVRQIIDIYKSKKKDSNNKTFGLSDFFDDRQRKVEDELSKLRKKNRELKYPTRLECVNFMPEARLREFAAALADKADTVRSRIEFLRRNKEGSSLDMNFKSPPGLRGIESGLINNNQFGMHLPSIHHHSYPTIDHHQNSMMMLLMKDHRSVQFGPGPGSGGGGNIQCASYERQVFYEAAAGGRGAVDPATMICRSPMQLARYYGPSVPPVPYMQMMPSLPYMQMPEVPMFPTRAESGGGGGGGHDGGDGQEDVVTRQYGMMMSHKKASSYND